MKLKQLFEAVSLELQRLVDELNKNRTIDEAKLLSGGIEVVTRRGDIVRFNEHKGKLLPGFKAKRPTLTVAM